MVPRLNASNVMVLMPFGLCASSLGSMTRRTVAFIACAMYGQRVERNWLNHSTFSKSPSGLASSLAHRGRLALDARAQRRRMPSWRTARVAALAAARRARSQLARRVLTAV